MSGNSSNTARPTPAAKRRRQGAERGGATLSACVALAVVACDRGQSVCDHGVAAEITGNHGHELRPPQKQGQRYDLVGGTHEHGVAMRETDLGKLKDGETTTTRASSTNAHTHEVTLKCKP